MQVLHWTNHKIGALGDGSVVKGVHYSCRGPIWVSASMLGGLKLPVISSPGKLNTSHLQQHQHSCAHTHALTHIHIIKSKIDLKSHRNQGHLFHSTKIFKTVLTSCHFIFIFIVIIKISANIHASSLIANIGWLQL